MQYGGPMWGASPTEVYLGVRRGGALPLPRATARVAPTRDKKCRRRRGHPYEGHEKRTDSVVRPNRVLKIFDRK